MSLSSCPAEIIIDIFKSFDVISSATALSQTSRKFHAVWRTNIISICDQVLPHGIEYKSQVHQIFEEMKQSVLLSSQSSAEDKSHADISLLAKPLFSIAKNALSKSQMDSRALGPRGRSFMDRRVVAFDASSHSRFLWSYYQTMSIMHLASIMSGEMNGTLSPLQLLEFLHMSESMIWILKTSASEPWHIFDSSDFFDNFDYIKIMESDLRGTLRNKYIHRHSAYQNFCTKEEDRLKLEIREMKGIILTHFLPLIFPKSSSYMYPA